MNVQPDVPHTTSSIAVITVPHTTADVGHAAFVRAIKDITFGSAAGMVSKVLEHPFDLTKVRLQSQVLDSSARFSGPIDCLVKTWRNEGVRGLYRGLPTPVVGAMAENATLFVAYSELQNAIRWAHTQPPSQDLTLPQMALAAAGAGAIASFVLTPIELVKCKMQVQMLLPTSLPSPSASHVPRTIPAHLPGPFSIVASILRTEGPRGLWLGHTGTLIRETGGSAAWFSTKEFVSAHLRRRRRRRSSAPDMSASLLPWESALSGACAGIVYNAILFPADTIKSAIQTEEELRPRAKGVPRSTFLGMGLAMWRKQGFRGLYAGCGVTVARAAPSSAVIFLIYDGLKSRFG